VIGDPLRLQQVLLNLVGNALKFTAHGSVTLSVQVARETDQELDIRCTVRDTGVGIGDEALDHALVLMDIQMPEMDGIEATRRIRQIPDREPLSIIAMTANALAEESSRCLATGMNDFISKPVEPELLFVTLLGWLDKGSVTRYAAGSQEIS